MRPGSESDLLGGMPQPYPIELRERAVEAYQRGQEALAVVACRFRIGEATLKRWVWRARTGTLPPHPGAGGTRSSIVASEVEALLTRLGDATAGELTAEFNRARRGHARVHVSSMKRALHRFGYVVKKNDAGRWKYCALTL